VDQCTCTKRTSRSAPYVGEKSPNRNLKEPSWTIFRPGRGPKVDAKELPQETPMSNYSPGGMALDGELYPTACIWMKVLRADIPEGAGLRTKPTQPRLWREDR
jgi:hypothetical protein